MLFTVPAQFGYATLAALIFGESAGLPLPGETALLTAGGLVASGQFALPLVVPRRGHRRDRRPSQ